MHSQHQGCANMVRRSLLVPLCLVTVTGMGEAMADASACYSIKNADERAYCLGLARQNHEYCYRIKDGDRRNECLAKTKGSRDHCHAINDHDSRKACLALIQ